MDPAEFHKLNNVDSSATPASNYQATLIGQGENSHTGGQIELKAVNEVIGYKCYSSIYRLGR